MKIDVEGSELNVLRSAGKIFNLKPRPLIMIEVVDKHLSGWGHNGNDIYDFFGKLSYKCYSFKEKGRLAPAFKKEHYHDNFIFVPMESLEQVKHLIER